MNKPVRYTMVPEARWQSIQKVLNEITAIHNDYRKGLFASDAAMALISSALTEIKDDGKRTSG